MKFESTAVENIQSFTYYEIKNSTIFFSYGHKNEVFENSTFKTGVEFNEYTYMRQKISYDIMNRSGEPSIQTAFAKLNIEGFRFNEDAIPFFVNSTAKNNETGNFEELEKITNLIFEYKSIEDLEPYIHTLIPSDNKWILLFYDFDYTYGHGHGIEESFGMTSIDLVSFTFEKYNFFSNVFVNSLVTKDNIRFKKEDFTPINGTLPGRVNLVSKKETATYELFHTSIEKHIDDYNAGLKPFIEAKFNVAWKEFGFDPKEIQNVSASAKPVSFFNQMTEVSVSNAIKPMILCIGLISSIIMSFILI
ncbi:hypothetical protein PIROE2DRAFT_2760 [Piromyces sp. E2]|nr:hypothetical protein PIROE2DRAFT_2760 [Piromyces sp. E2]|eukprot:OUM69266.1 hypothetical protein PIROE2DRAFT_2760 [Piromyces sp. E2]